MNSPENKSAPVKVVNLDYGIILFFIFLVLKLTGVITWSWWWVFSPLWIPFVIIIFLVVLVGVLSGVLSAFGK